ncbi:MAG TPA: hypothetical protein VF612_10480 [Jatrophihabitans sp.]|uniref:hypothetical protein n=1 Tax=Jatrophihabitans sp. TaxID=1932789 RepID=UPI002EFEA329
MKPAAEHRLAGHGLAVALPARWEGRLYRRTVGQPGATLHAQATGTGTGWPGELSHPVLHLANFALPASRGDYGTGAVELMGPDNLFVALLEFGPDCLGTALYSPRGLPRVTPGQFNPNGMQRRIAGQAGLQHFFTQGNRPFCLYVVIGSHRQAVALAKQANEVLERIEVEHAG